MSRARLGMSYPVLMTVVAILLQATSVPAVAVAQSGRDCWEYARVVTGQNEDGNPTYGWELINTCEDGDGNAGGGQYACRHSTRGEVPCHDPVWGWWSDAEQCYASLLDPQPPAGDPLWQGHEPAAGGIYQLRCPGDAVGVAGAQPSIRLEFLPAAPHLPTIAQLAQQAMRSLELRPADIGTAPSRGGAGLVGLPVWLWTDNAEVTWGPVAISVPGPRITVSAEGSAVQIEWDMGDGHTVVCDEPGLPYEDHYGTAASDCGHVYRAASSTQPDGRYRVTATTTWRVRWWVEPRRSGAEGEDFFFREATTSVRINELHVVTS